MENNTNSSFTLEFGASPQHPPEMASAVQPKPELLAPQTEPALSLSSLNPQEQQVVKDFVQKIDINDSNAIMQYGAAAQNKIAQFSDSVLQNVKTKDTGAVGKSLSDLVVEIKSMDMEEKGGLFGIFGGNKIVKQIEKMTANYSKVETNIDKIVSSLESHQRVLLKDIAMLDSMYENNLTYFRELSMYIIAGNEKLKQFNEVDIPTQRKVVEQTNDEMETQKLNDMIQSANRFDKKLHDLKISRTISIQMAPQIRMIQNNNAALVEKIQSSIVNAIPLWKNQIVIALSLSNSKAALSAQKKVTDLTNEMLVKNSEMLRQGSVEVAKESERSIVSIETVRKTNDNLIATINEVLEVQKKGREERAIAETELGKMEQGLKQALISAGR